MKKLSLLLALSALAGASQAVTLFDGTGSVSSYYNSTAGITNYNQVGEILNLASSNNVLSGITINAVPTAAGVYTDVQAVVSFYSAFPDSYTSTAAAFSGLISSSTVDFGAQTFTSGFYNTLSGTLSNPATVTGNKVGMVITFLSNTGSGLVPATAIETGLNLSTAPLAGSNGDANGYQLTWGQAAAAGSTVPTGTQYLYFGTTYSNLAVTLTGQPVPEPSAFAALGLGAIAVLRRRSKKA